MPSLIICKNKKDYSIFTFNDSIKIGREEENTIILDGSDISRVHAFIDRVGNEWILRDNKSTNGTLIMDEKVSQTCLHQGDNF